MDTGNDIEITTIHENKFHKAQTDIENQMEVESETVEQQETLEHKQSNHSKEFLENLNRKVSASRQQEFDANKMMRLGFIRKVYGLLSLQLIITFFICAVPFMSEGLRNFFQTAEWLFWLSVIGSFGVVIPLICFKSVARRVPTNYILTVLWTACEAFMVARLCSLLDGSTVLAAALMTIASVVALTIYAFRTKTDFSMYSGALFMGLATLSLFGLLSMFYTMSDLIYCLAGVIIFSGYIILDTQLIMGRFGSEYDVEDYIIATLNIYLDVLQLFLYILELLSRR